MSDLTINGAQLLALLGLLGGCISLLFRSFIAEKDAKYEARVQWDEQRYRELRDDRDRCQRSADARELTQAKTLEVLAEGMAIIRPLIEELARREGRRARG